MIASEKIFGEFDSKLLRKIATQRCLNVMDENDEHLPKADIVKILSEDIRDVGFSRMLHAIRLKELKAMGEIVAKNQNTDRIQAIKRVLEKRIKEYSDDIGRETFLNSVSSGIKKEIIHTLDLEVDEARNYTEAILAEAEAIGQEYFFSTFSTEKLAKFALSCGLDVDSLSQNVLVECLMSLQSYKAPKKKPAPKPSKKKPEKIAKGISKIDLNSHYNKEELVEYCKENKLPVTGNKRDLIAKILAHVEGREIPLPKGSKKRRKKTSDTDKKSKRKRETSSGESSPKKRASKDKKSASSSSEEVSEKPKKKK
jgi:hypothetical protein